MGKGNRANLDRLLRSAWEYQRRQLLLSYSPELQTVKNNKAEKSVVSRFFANAFVQAVCVFIALAVAFSGKLDTHGTTVTILIAFCIGSIGIWTHCSDTRNKKILASLLIVVFSGALVAFNRYLTGKLPEANNNIMDSYPLSARIGTNLILLPPPIKLLNAASELAINDLSRIALADFLENSAGELENTWNRYWSEDGKLYGQIEYLWIDPNNKKEVDQLAQKRVRIKSVFTSEVKEMFRDIDPYRAEGVKRLGSEDQADAEEEVIFRAIIAGNVRNFTVDYVHAHSAYLRALAKKLRS